ncbi:single-stranded DNA-binding protein [bacterium]|nr:single-stranded DNA-binding protein [bacterium]
MNMNSVVIVGRAGQDPEVKYFESGKVKTTFSVAVSRWDYKTKSETTDWFNIELWDKSAEIAGEYVKKGRQVCVDGRLISSKWTGQDGEQRERFIIRANSMRLLGNKSDN